MAIILVVGYFINNLNKSHIFRIFALLLVCGSVFGNDLVSNYNYLRATNDMSVYNQILSEIDETDAKLIYIWNNSENEWSNKILERNLRVLDLSRIYKCVEGEGFYHWGDYMYYDKNEEYSGPTILIFDKNGREISSEILEKYEFIKEIDNYNIYSSNENVIKFE